MARHHLYFLKIYNRSVCLFISTLLLIFHLTALRDAAAGISPDPLADADTSGHYEEAGFSVRMLEEDVVMTVFEDTIKVATEFLFFNPGAQVIIDVGFPYRFSGEYTEFKAYVDGQLADVTDEMKRDNENNRITGLWKIWNVKFDGNKESRIRIEYCTEPLIGIKKFNENVYTAILPEDSLAVLQMLTTFKSAKYPLKPSRNWKGLLDRCKVSLELKGKTDECIRVFGPDDGRYTENGITWEYTDYEPVEDIMISYHPSMNVKEIKPYLLDFLGQYPGNPRLVNDIGNVLRSLLGELELQKELFHSFLSGWDRPIPQLMLYAPGGKCRFDYNAEGHFLSAWMMARSLLLEYQRTEELCNAVDIAPVIVEISGAVVDSLETCSGLPERDERMLMKSRELLEIAGGLIN